ncbi:MAG TPA: phenylalanine--tRNA ligase subunit alpha [Candidatus Thermoplasmatota archaeon]|nr:phenylalanine--tRNA ligase subunit alpha [Candidatus Thermoplasmatota archaeon]
MAPELSLAEKRLLLALPKDGKAAMASAVAGFASEGEALQAAGGLQRAGFVEAHEDATVLHQLSGEGRRIVAAGLPEVRARAALTRAMSVPELAKAAGLSEAESRVVVGLLKKNGWAEMAKGAAGPELRPASAVPAVHPLSKAMAALAAGPLVGPASPDVAQLMERGLAEAVRQVRRSLRLTPTGQALAKTLKPDDVAGSEVNQLTPELVAAWATMTPQQKAQQRLRPFDFGVDVAVPAPGKAHPLTHIIQEIRDIFVALGFQEIAGDYVEPAFWNMDALFIPQDHPARDMQDTFYVRDPARMPVEEKLFETVKKVQQTGGGTGSTSWGGSFKREESERALLRTHTTVTTIRHLAAHPQGPTRVFGIGRVFRNEAMDATHLPEFHQVEGIVVEQGATLAMLMGILREFYRRMGFPEVKFRPSFYPYTEPSLDVAVKWNGKWLELGGAGVFRPEVTHPLGVKSPVLAWGLGLERLAMLRLGLTDIRQLYLSDVQWLRESPLR